MSDSNAQMQSLSRGFEVFVGTSFGDVATHACSAGAQYSTAGPGPVDVFCDCFEGTHVTLRHVGAQATVWLALSELEVWSAAPPPPTVSEQ